MTAPLCFELQYDTVHGPFAGNVSGDDAAKELIVDGRKIQVCCLQLW